MIHPNRKSNFSWFRLTQTTPVLSDPTHTPVTTFTESQNQASYASVVPVFPPMLVQVFRPMRRHSQQPDEARSAQIGCRFSQWARLGSAHERKTPSIRNKRRPDITEVGMVLQNLAILSKTRFTNTGLTCLPEMRRHRRFVPCPKGRRRKQHSDWSAYKAKS